MLFLCPDGLYEQYNKHSVNVVLAHWFHDCINRFTDEILEVSS